MQPAWTLPKKMCKRRADALTLASLDKYKENDWLWQVCASARNAAMKNAEKYHREVPVRNALTR